MRVAALVFAVTAAIAGRPAAAQQAALLADGAFEMITWTADQPDEKFRDVCTVTAGQMRCTMHKQMGIATYDSVITGTLRGNQIASRGHLRIAIAAPNCSYVMDADRTGRIMLFPDGTMTSDWDGGPSTNSSISGACASTMPRNNPPGPPSHWTGNWRALGAAEAMVETAPPTIVAIAPDGKAITIDLDEWKGGKLTIEQMELVKQFQIKPPSDGAGYTLQAWRYGEAQRKDVPVYMPTRRLDEVMAEGAYDAGSSALSCAQSAASWAKANPGKASLMALGLAVSIAMPYTVSFHASAGSMTFLESAGIGFMTSATPAAVQTLVGSAMSGEGFWKSSGRAAFAGGIAGAESLIGTTVGAGVTGAVETGAALTRKLVGARISEEAVKGFGSAASGIAGSATDYGVGILHDKAADAIAQSAAKTTIPDLVPSARSTLSGGIVLPILSKPVSR